MNKVKKKYPMNQPPPELAKTPLQKWVSEKGYTAREFTELMGDYCHKYITIIINGARKPSVRLARKIEEVTNGDVKARDMLGI